MLVSVLPPSPRTGFVADLFPVLAALAGLMFGALAGLMFGALAGLMFGAVVKRRSA